MGVSKSVSYLLTAAAGIILIPLFMIAIYVHIPAGVPAVQNLICRIPATADPSIIASGYITHKGGNRFKIESVNGVEYFIKGDMDSCMIQTPRNTNSA